MTGLFRGDPPIPTPAEYSKKAKQAARGSNYAQAGDFYRLAGDWKRANEMYLKGGYFDLAARLAELKKETRDVIVNADNAVAHGLWQRVINAVVEAGCFPWSGTRAEAE